MTYSLIQQLDENTLFRAKKLKIFSLRDLADLTFLYCIVLHIMRQEFLTSTFAIRYATRTGIHGDFSHTDVNNTDLYQMLNIFSHPDEKFKQLAKPENSEVLWYDMDWHNMIMRRFLANINRKKYDDHAQRQLLFQLERQLHIINGNYKSIRRISVEWSGPLITEGAKKLAITRLLQALRARARPGDILKPLNELSVANNYELKNVCDPETGKNCEKDTVTIPKSKFSFLQKLALSVGAGVVAGKLMSPHNQGK
jgi:hypothetical protein